MKPIKANVFTILLLLQIMLTAIPVPDEFSTLEYQLKRFIMANSKDFMQFLLPFEGGLSKNVNDRASAFPVPDSSSYHTNKGITWRTFRQYAYLFNLISEKEKIQRFYNLSDNDIHAIMKAGYWDKIKGDEINSQRIANAIADFAFNSGAETAIKHVQRALMIAEDGLLGRQTLKAINSYNEGQFLEEFRRLRLNFIATIAANDGRQNTFLEGWRKRINKITSV